MEYDYYEDRVRIPEEEHRRRVTRQMQLRRHLRSTNDPFSISSTEFYRLYRMPQYRVIELTELIRPYVRQRHGSSYIALEIKMLCAVGFYAQGSYQRPRGRMVDLNLSQASVSYSLHEVTMALNHADILTRFIHFPTTRAERDAVIHRNAALGLPGVVGYINGTLVKIVPPSGPDKYIYRSRKGFTALNVQVVCDSNLRILNVNAQFPGSANDPWIFRRSCLRAVMREAFNVNPCLLLGVSIYPHEPWMQLPVIHAQHGTPEYRYTRLHCNNRNCVERCIGVLKARWRCLLCDRTLHYAPLKGGLIVNACAVLHNYLREINAPDPQPVFENNGEDDPDEPDEEEQPILQQADDVRRYLIQVANERYLRLHEND